MSGRENGGVTLTAEDAAETLFTAVATGTIDAIPRDASPVRVAMKTGPGPQEDD